ncbi:MAG: hypothetical protein AAF447_03270 [Myxococcota bacterium]
MSLALLFVAACGAPDALDDRFPAFDAGTLDPMVGPSIALEVDRLDVAVVSPAEKPDPVFGGTLTRALSGDLALAAEPARDRLHVVDLGRVGWDDARRAQRELSPGDRPWRSVAVPGGWVVTLRKGSVIRVSETLEEQWRADLPAPRGLDVEGDIVWVATAGGTLVGLDVATGEELRRHELPRDLRDVVAVSGSLFVSRFHSAEVLKIERGEVVETFAPPASAGTRVRVAWRLTATPEGRLVLLTQAHGLGTIDNQPNSPRATAGSGGYGTAAPQPTPGSQGLGPVTPQILTFDADFGVQRKVTLSDASLVVDVAARENRFLVAAAGGHEARVLGLRGEPLGSIEAPQLADLPGDRGRYGSRGLVTAVAFNSAGEAVAQSAGDSQLRSVHGHQPLSDTPLFDGGRLLFHERQDSGLACASCHPEGGDDGHVWNFAVGGLRRTQPLGGGLAASAPFHWDGSIPSLSAIVRHNMNLMGGLATDPQVEAVMGWMESIPAQTVGEVLDAADEAAGEAAFAAAGCADCHTGSRLSDGQRHRLRGTVLDTPSLRGAGVRSGLLHDGCVPDVAALGTLARCRDGVHDLEDVSDEDREALLRFVAAR